MLSLVLASRLVDGFAGLMRKELEDGEKGDQYDEEEEETVDEL